MSTMTSTRKLRRIVESINNEIAVVLVGEAREPWNFPMQIMPKGAGPDSVLILEPRDGSLDIIELDLATEMLKRRTFEDRLRRARFRTLHKAGPVN